MNQEIAVDENDEVEDDTQMLSFLFLFDQLPVISAALLERGLAKFCKLTQPLQVTDMHLDAQPPHATVHFDGHTLLLVAYDEPVAPEGMQNAIECSNWPQADKQPLRTHQAHMICFYLDGSDDATGQIIASMRLAGAFLDSGLLGYLDPAAWNCMPAPRLREGLSAKAKKSFREHVPLGVFTGFVKLFVNETDIWFCTKGYYRWGIPDLAFFGQLADAQEAFDMFGDLFFYSLDSDVQIIAGNTAELAGNVLLTFEALSEDEAYLQTPMGTLVIKKVLRAQMH